jgi:outer membrane protein TolC
MRTLCFAVLIIACVGNTVVAAEPLSLDDCVRLAESAPSAVAMAARQTLIEHARVDQASAGLLPRVSFFGGYARNGSANDTPSFVSLNGSNQYTALVAVNQEVDLSGKLRSAKVRTRADEDAARFGQRISRRELRRAVATAYHRVLLSRHLVEVTEESLAESERFAVRASLLSSKGEAARADIVKAQAQAGALAQALSAATLDASLANADLAAFWTDEVAMPLALVDVLEQAPAPPPASVDAATAVSQRPELAMTDARIRSVQAGLQGARAARYPQGNIVLEYGLDSTRLAWRDRGYALLFGLNIPIFDWSIASNAALQFSLQTEQLQLERQVAQRAYCRDYQTALLRVRSLNTQIGGALAQVSLAKENLALSRLRYDGGEGNALEVVSAQTQLAQARVDHLNVLAGYHAALVDLSLAGGP